MWLFYHDLSTAKPATGISNTGAVKKASLSYYRELE